MVHFHALEPCVITLLPVVQNLELILQHGVLAVTVVQFGHHNLLNLIGLPPLKASHSREVMCCSKRRLGMSYLRSCFGFTIYQVQDHGQVWNLWDLSSTSFTVTIKTCIWSSLYINAVIILLISDTVTWTQSPSGGSPSVGLHSFLLGALTPPNRIPWGLSVVARTGLCWQCRWCYPLSSSHTSTACAHCCPRLHHDVCSYL